MFWILAQHQDAQNRLRIEIREAKQDGNDLTYDQLEKLPYLDAICRETLRLSVVIAYQELLLTKYLQISSCKHSLPNVSFHFLSCSSSHALYTSAQQGAILPLGTPIKCLDGRELSEIPIPKGTDFSISILGCNHDPKTWGPDAAEWKPERWLQPLPDSVTAARIPGVYSNL